MTAVGYLFNSPEDLIRQLQEQSNAIKKQLARGTDTLNFDRLKQIFSQFSVANDAPDQELKEPFTGRLKKYAEKTFSVAFKWSPSFGSCALAAGSITYLFHKEAVKNDGLGPLIAVAVGAAVNAIVTVGYQGREYLKAHEKKLKKAIEKNTLEDRQNEIIDLLKPIVTSIDNYMISQSDKEFAECVRCIDEHAKASTEHEFLTPHYWYSILLNLTTDPRIKNVLKQLYQVAEQIVEKHPESAPPSAVIEIKGKKRAKKHLNREGESISAPSDIFYSKRGHTYDLERKLNESSAIPAGNGCINF